MSNERLAIACAGIGIRDLERNWNNRIEREGIAALSTVFPERFKNGALVATSSSANMGIHSPSNSISEDERKICKAMGLEPTKFLEMKARRGVAAASSKTSSYPSGGISKDELKVCKVMGLEPAKFIQMKAQCGVAAASSKASSYPSGGISEDERKICKAMGLEPTKYMQAKANAKKT
ncbi:hypothetical protein [Burkholderia sp. LMG 21824]|uniref:hypothetical protein n=1 Tax=Burkholderia sp. LMG 21824 TaxID=3158172 RepID=UPI003C304595